MLFNSFQFLCFFAVVYALYLRMGRRQQNWLLLIAGYIFYGAWNWKFLGLIALTTVVDFYCSTAMHASTNERRRRLLLAVCIVLHVTILGTFKYYDFFAWNLQQLLGHVGIDASLPFLKVMLPVGVSFYTFQSISYIVDVYRRQLEPARRLWDYALYVVFFPQLVAGPIERGRHLLPQLLAPRRVTLDDFYEGAFLFCWGLFKKVFVADNLAQIVDEVFNKSGMQWNGTAVMLAVYAFAFQIYGDFSGYSDMARGLGRVLGFDILVNFRLPYLARNPAEFWHRWHISLSTWLRDYLYIPLGGSRRGSVRTSVNLFVTMVLGGLWHGAAGTFLVWGAYHGALLVGHRWFARRGTPAEDAAQRRGLLATVVHGLKIVACFHAVCLGWLLFRANSLEQVGAMLEALIGAPVLNPTQGVRALRIAAYVLPMLAVEALQARRDDLMAAYRLPLVPRMILYTVVLNLIVIFGVSGSNAFIYFQF